MKKTILIIIAVLILVAIIMGVVYWIKSRKASDNTVVEMGPTDMGVSPANAFTVYPQNMSSLNAVNAHK